MVLWSLLFCALAYGPTRWLHEANPIWRLTSLLLALEVIAITLLVVAGVEWRVSGGRREAAGVTNHVASGAPVASSSGSPVVSLSGSPVVPWSRSLIFPICFFLVAVPWPSGLENFVVQSLTRLNVASTVEVLGVLGIPALQHGNAIEVGGGMVGIDEGCSGIRSFQATLMIGLFLGELYRFAVLRRSVLCLLGLGLAFLFNLGRTSLLTWVAAHQGTAAMAQWHDPAGVAALVGCFLALWASALWLRRERAEGRRQRTEDRRQRTEDGGQRAEGRGQCGDARGETAQGEHSTFNIEHSTADEQRDCETTRPQDHKTTGLQDYRTTGPACSGSLAAGSSSLLSSVLRPLPSVLRPMSSVLCPRPSGLVSWSRSPVVSWSLLAWFLLVEGGTELWYRAHEGQEVARASQWAVRTDAMGPGFERSEVPPNIAGQFQADEALQGRWQDAAGYSWQLYYFRWRPTRSLDRRVAVQLAKTHGPEKCLPAIGMSMQSYLGVITVPLAEGRLALQQYLFTAEGRPVHVFYGIHEDASGLGVLANRRQDAASRVAAALAGSRNYGQSYLELAVSGLDDPQEAQAALRRQLERLIKL